MFSQDSEVVERKEAYCNKVVGGEDLEELPAVSKNKVKKQLQNSTTMSNTELKESVKSRTTTKFDHDKVILQ